MDNLVKGMLKSNQFKFYLIIATMVTQGTQIDESIFWQDQLSLKNTTISKHENSFMVGNTSRSHISKVDDPQKSIGANKEDL